MTKQLVLDNPHPFEDYIKDAMQTGYSPIKKIGWRWHDPEDVDLTLDMIQKGLFSFADYNGVVYDILHYCDDNVTWAPLHIPGSRLYKLEFMITHPCLFMDWQEPFEDFDKARFDQMRSIGFDAAAFVQIKNAKKDSLRQGALLNPSKQIVSVEKVFVV